MYTNSFCNMNFSNMHFTNIKFQKVVILHLTRTRYQTKSPPLTQLSLHFVLTDCTNTNNHSTTFPQNQEQRYARAQCSSKTGAHLVQKHVFLIKRRQKLLRNFYSLSYHYSLAEYIHLRFLVMTNKFEIRQFII